MTSVLELMWRNAECFGGSFAAKLQSVINHEGCAIMTMSVPGSDISMNGARQLMVYDNSKKSLGVAFMFWIFLGGIGAHRYYLGRTGSAVGMTVLFILSFLFTAVGVGVLGFMAVGIWALIDAFLMSGITAEFNNRLMARIS